MPKYVLRDGVLEGDIAKVIRQTQPAVKKILEGIEPKTDARKVLDELRKTKSRLQKDVGDVDSKAILSTLMNEKNSGPEAVKIRRLLEHLQQEKKKWWYERVLNKSLIGDIVSEELGIGILEAIKSGIEIKKYVKEEVVVRRAEEKDIPDIVKMVMLGVKEEHGIDRLTENAIEEIRKNHRQYYLGFVEGNLAGVRALYPHHRVSWISPTGLSFELQNVAYMKNGFVLPEYRKKGVSSAIDKKILDDAKKLGVKEVYDSTETDFMLTDRLKKGFSLLGLCTMCPRGLVCSGSLVKKELR